MSSTMAHRIQRTKRRSSPRQLRLALLATTTALLASAPSVKAGNEWHIVGTSGVSAQQLFRMENGDVMIIDKVENNPLRLNGAPASAVQYNTETNTYEAKEIHSNAFCAGGNVLANGTWIALGGNKAVTYGGLDGTPGARPYDTQNGGTAIRVLNPCPTGEDCEWVSNGNMQSERWYPTVETLQDGSLAVIGGMRDGNYVNTEGSDNPTIEYFPSKGDQIGLNILAETLPCNLYALTWLLPSGNLLIQSNLKATIFDWRNAIERPIDDMPHAVRVYPASGATAMLPLTPANNWTATILFCGGTDLQPEQWSTSPTWNVAAYPADASCVSITPSESDSWKEEDSMFEGRSMGQFIILPNGKLFHLNGIATGTAGYGNATWAIGQSYGDNPLLSSAYYDPLAASGQRWSRPAGTQMTVQRLYHSSATLLADGSILNAGSNPNADYIPRKGFRDEKGRVYTYPTEYRVEKFYPDYYNETRPAPTGLPTTLGYGGQMFNVTLSAADLGNDVSKADTVMLGVMRTGFSTHAINMGMRYVQLNTTYTVNADGSATIFSEQMPPNPSIMAPGPALLFVVVDGVPSVGVDIMVGSGRIGNQTVNARAILPGTISGSGATPAVVATSASSSSSSTSPASSSSSTSTSRTASASSRASASRVPGNSTGGFGAVGVAAAAGTAQSGGALRTLTGSSLAGALLSCVAAVFALIA